MLRFDYKRAFDRPVGQGVCGVFMSGVVDPNFARSIS